jgi:hypothetical protein
MNAATLKALKGSIKKWDTIVDGTGVDVGTGNCPLCLKFFHASRWGICGGCPVKNATGRVGCVGTPYFGVL